MALLNDLSTLRSLINTAGKLIGIFDEQGRNTLIPVWYDATYQSLYSPTLAGPLIMPTVVAASGVPVMIAQSGMVTAAGILVPGASTPAATVTLSATSGAGVTITLGAAVLLGTAADVGTQITYMDGTTFRSALITAFGTTTTCTATLLGTATGLGPFATNTWLGDPLPIAYVGVWVYLPAGATVSGLAGFYWSNNSLSGATCSSLLNISTQYLGAMALPAVGSGSVTAVGAATNFVGVTTEITVATMSVTGGVMGSNGALHFENLMSTSAAAPSAVTTSLKLGTLVMTTNALLPAVTATGRFNQVIRNRGSSAVQITHSPASAPGVASALPVVLGAVPTSSTQTMLFTMQLAAPGTYAVQESFVLTLLPKA